MVYIGQSVDIKKRWKTHKAELQKGTHGNMYLQDAWNIYGEAAFSFDVLEKCRSVNLNELERFYINQYNSTDRSRGYNISPGLGKTLVKSKRDARVKENRSVVIVSESDKTHDLCITCEYSCKQSCKNEILMCRKIAEKTAS